MKEYIIDCRMMTDRSSVHEYLAAALELPEYYGKNLDALHDCLGELAPCRLILRNISAIETLGEYGEALKSVLLDVCIETPLIELTLESGAATDAVD